MVTGTFRSYSARKGFGFIDCDGSDVFVGYSDLGGRVPQPGEKVTCKLESGEKGFVAKNVKFTVTEEEAVFAGTIKFYSIVKAYGYITSDAFEGKDVFFAKNMIQDTVSAPQLREGTWVTFKITRGEKGPQCCAMFINDLDPAKVRPAKDRNGRKGGKGKKKGEEGDEGNGGDGEGEGEGGDGEGEGEGHGKGKDKKGKSGGKGYKGGKDGYKGGKDGYTGGFDGFKGGYKGGKDGFKGGKDGFKGGFKGCFNGEGGEDGYGKGYGYGYGDWGQGISQMSKYFARSYLKGDGKFNGEGYCGMFAPGVMKGTNLLDAWKQLALQNATMTQAVKVQQKASAEDTYTEWQ